MKNYTLITVTLSLFLIAAQIDLWIGRGGLLQYWQLKSELQQQQDENIVLENRNSVLHAGSIRSQRRLCRD